MKKCINDVIERFPFAPVWLFAVGGMTVFGLIYLGPASYASIFAIIGLILFALFVLFLVFCRSGDRVAIGTAGPAIIGPALAHLYVNSRAPYLEPVLRSGGDLLIQLAFFFASLFGTAAYIFLMFGEEEARHRTKARICFGLFILVCFVIMFFDLTSTTGRSGPTLLFGIEAPRLTSLTGCRAGLALFSIVVAVWPKSTQSAVKV